MKIRWKRKNQLVQKVTFYHGIIFTILYAIDFYADSNFNESKFAGNTH